MSDPLAPLYGRIEQLEVQLAQAKAGKCVKCNMGPLRESCAYPEACEHPGRELADKLGHAHLDLAQVRQEYNVLLDTANANDRELREENTKLRQRVGELDEEVRLVSEQRDMLVTEYEPVVQALRQRVGELEARLKPKRYVRPDFSVTDDQGLE
jgi:hypothetical protein